VATAELKNPLTHQNVEHAISQYRQRDARAPLFQFKKRALVHFAVDPDLVYTTTQLKSCTTSFAKKKPTSNAAPRMPGARTAYAGRPYRPCRAPVPRMPGACDGCNPVVEARRR
jgi:type I restriction enzyme R subunit